MRVLAKELLEEFGRDNDCRKIEVRKHMKEVKEKLAELEKAGKDPSVYYYNGASMTPEQFNLSSCDCDSDLFGLAEYLQANSIPNADWDNEFYSTLPRSFLLDAIHEAASEHILFKGADNVVEINPEQRQQLMWSEEEMAKIDRALTKAERVFTGEDDPHFRAMKRKLLANQVKLESTTEAKEDYFWTLDSSALLAFGWAVESFIKRMLHFMDEVDSSSPVLDDDDFPDHLARVKPLESEDSWIEGDGVISDSSD